MFSNYAAVPEEGRGWRLVRNVVIPQRAPRGGWREGMEDEEGDVGGVDGSNHSVYSDEGGSGEDKGGGRYKNAPPIIIVMPGGKELCTACVDQGFLEAAASAKKEKVGGEGEEQLKISSSSGTVGVNVATLDIKESSGSSQSGEPSSSSSVGSPSSSSSSSSSAASSIVGDREAHQSSVGMAPLPPLTQQHQQQEEEEGRRIAHDPTDDAAVDRSERGIIGTTGTGRGIRSTSSTNASSRPPTRRSHSHRQPRRRIPIMYKIELDDPSQESEDDQQ